jgi:hypothetical protein
MSKKQQKPTAKDVRDSKGKKRPTQPQIVFAEFLRMPQTMKEVSVRTGIMRENICRIVSRFRKANAIASFSVGICPITKHRKVNRWTTDPDQFPKSKQMKLSFQ